jgi:predicted acetyltransferase
MEPLQLEDCYELWKECFDDTKQYMDYYFKEKGKDNHILTLYEGKQLTAMLHLNPYFVKFQGKKEKANYIVGVATAKAFRKQGRMRSLLEESFQWMKEQGQVFTYLMPADEAIYRPFGFEFIYSQNRLHLGKIKNTGWQIEDGWRMESIQDLSQVKLEKLVSYVQDILEEHFTLFGIRSISYYKRLVKEMQAANGDVLCIYKGENLVGVVAYMLENGFAEIVESIINPIYTKEFISCLFYKILSKEIEVTFLESYFLQVTALKEMFPQLKEKVKPIIMAKLLSEEQESVHNFFKNERIYLNEIV